MAKVFANTKDMSREEWLEQRKHGIGGSEASAIMGLNPYATPLKVYLDKIGKGEEKETTEAMRQGTDLEQYVAERFTEETGMKVRKVHKILQHPQFPWMLANIDRDIIGVDAGLECKTTSPYSKFKFDEGEINPHYYWQSMHYMAVTGAAKWYVAILVLGKSFHVFEVARDEEAIQTLVNAERCFWKEHVEKKVPPLPTGSDVDDEAISELYPQGMDGIEGEDVCELDEMEELLNLRAYKANWRDQIDAEIKEIDQKVKLKLGDFQKGLSHSWKVSWTNTSTSRIDTKLLKEKYPHIADECMKVTAGRRFTVTRTKEDE